MGIEFIQIKPEIQNIVTASDLGRTLDLNHLVVLLGFDNVEYNPESFVGLVYRVPEYLVTLMIFSSGKINILGTKKPEDARLALDKLKLKENYKYQIGSRWIKIVLKVTIRIQGECANPSSAQQLFFGCSTSSHS